MDQTHAKVRCGACGAPVDEPIDIDSAQRRPCSECGSTSRIFAKDDLEGELAPAGTLRARGYRAGLSKWFIEIVQGVDFSTRLRRWMKKLRIIDREQDRYVEAVVDPETGNKIHDVDEPLSSHTGHGSDRRH